MGILVVGSAVDFLIEIRGDNEPDDRYRIFQAQEDKICSIVSSESNVARAYNRAKRLKGLDKLSEEEFEEFIHKNWRRSYINLRCSLRGGASSSALKGEYHREPSIRRAG